MYCAGWSGSGVPQASPSTRVPSQPREGIMMAADAKYLGGPSVSAQVNMDVRVRTCVLTCVCDSRRRASTRSHCDVHALRRARESLGECCLLVLLQ